MSPAARFKRWILGGVTAMPDGRLKYFYSQLSARTVIAFIVFSLAIMVFVGIADQIREQDAIFFDAWALQSVHDYFGSAFLDSIMPTLTDVGGVVGIALLSVATVLVFSLKKQYRRVFIVAAGVGGAVILNQVLKVVFARARPDLWEQLVVEHSFSFPSGHSMASSAFALSVIVALWYSRCRWLSVIGGGAYVVFVGFSRLYLGVHYPTDVIAGWAVSLAWVLLVMALLKDSKRSAQLNDRAQ